ncbi:hypothetical protein Q5O24_11365 [Eubacteriaceae bacterium ES3]|nr:hypothetical protein Q5O24_11365 [Eubacteriaceae bacterium ES3]
MKKKIAILMSGVLSLSMVMSSGVWAASETLETASTVGVEYKTHIQDYGWESEWKEDGVLSGTVGQGKRLEALRIELTGNYPSDAEIQTYVHVQNYGDKGPFTMGQDAGTSGEGLRLERIRLVLKNLPAYTLAYNVQVENYGWLRDEYDTTDWFRSGEVAGTTGMGLRLEGIRIELIKVNEAYAAYLEALSNVDEDDYTIDSWKTYKRVVTAYAMTEDDDEELIDLATETIVSAQKNLVKGMNMKKYKEALAKVTEENYTPDSWSAYQTIVNRNYVDQSNTQSEIDEATVNILEAQKLLEGKVNLTEYLELLASVREDNYTALSWFFYQQSVNSNQVDLSNTQTQVDKAVENIKTAQNKLVRKFDFSAYNALLKAVEQEDYTTISWGKYQAAIEEYGVTENDTQSDIEEAILAIEEAQKGLVKGSDLSAYYAVLDNVDKYSCTTDSWTAYQKVVDKNYVTKDSPQSDVDKAAETILKAQLKLVGLGDLSEYLDILDQVIEEDYTPKSWATYQKVVKANIVTEASGQSAIDSAIVKIAAAQLKLELAGDLTEYNALLDSYNSTQNQWTSDSWTAFQKVVTSNYMTTDDNQTDINSAMSKIKLAYLKLIERGDITEFTTLINSVSQDDYTVDSWTDYRKVLMKYYMTEDNSQAEITEAVLKITLAQLELVYKGDVTAYEELIESKSGMADSYTTASWAAYQAVLAANVMTTENTNSEIAVAIQRIKAAQDRLIKASNMTYYNNALHAYDGLESEYTETSWAVYQAVIIKNLVTKDNTQSEVDTATVNITNAAKNLVRSTNLSNFLTTLGLYQRDKIANENIQKNATAATWADYEYWVEYYAAFDETTWDYDESKDPKITSSSSQNSVDIATGVIQEALDNILPDQTAAPALYNAYSAYVAAIKLDGNDTQEMFTLDSYTEYQSTIDRYPLTKSVIEYDAPVLQGMADTIQSMKDKLEKRVTQANWDLFEAEAAIHDTLNSANYTQTSWNTYSDAWSNYYDNPIYAYTQDNNTDEEVIDATKDLREKRIGLIIASDKRTIDTVSSRLTNEAIQVMAYQEADTYKEGVVMGENLLDLAVDLIDDKYTDPLNTSYTVTLTPAPTTANVNVDGSGIVNGLVDQKVTISFTVSDGSTTKVITLTDLPIISNP